MAGGGSGPGGRSEFRAHVDVFGADRAAKVIMAMGERAYNTLPLMEDIKEDLAILSRMRVQKAPWAPLTEQTIARKASQGENTAILRDEWRPIAGKPTRVGNKLYLALTLEDATGQIKRATRTWAIFGVDTKGDMFYARFVQNTKGTKRRLLAINADQALAITIKVSNYIERGRMGFG